MREDAEAVEVQLPITVEAETELEQDPVAGTCGTLVELVHEPCECGCDIARHSAIEPAGVHHVECLACEHVHYQG